MLRIYLPAIVFLLLGGIVGATFSVLNAFAGRRRHPNRNRDEPYECGLPSEVKRGFRFGISFYLVAMLFILFDIEVIFLYPIAVQLRAFGTLRDVRDRDVFVVLLMIAFVYVWRRGALGMEIKREPLPDFRVRQLKSRDMLRGDADDEELEATSSSG